MVILSYVLVGHHKLTKHQRNWSIDFWLLVQLTFIDQYPPAPTLPSSQAPSIKQIMQQWVIPGDGPLKMANKSFVYHWYIIYQLYNYIQVNTTEFLLWLEQKIFWNFSPQAPVPPGPPSPSPTSVPKSLPPVLQRGRRLCDVFFVNVVCNIFLLYGAMLRISLYIYLLIIT